MEEHNDVERIEDKVVRRRPERGKDDRFINLSLQEKRDRKGEEERKLKKDKKIRGDRCNDNRPEKG